MASSKNHLYHPILIMVVLGGTLLCCNSPKVTQSTIDPTIKYNQIQSIKVDEGLLDLYTHAGRSEEIPIDSSVYKALIQRKKSTTCANVLAYANTSMKMIRLTRAEDDFQLYKYQRCRAIMMADTIKISFGFPPFAGGNISYFAGKPLELTIANQQYQTTLTHTSDALSATKVNGKWVQTPFPTSDFLSTALTLSQANYAVGDTIRGNFKAKAHFQSKRHPTPNKEIIRGYFRVILEDEASYCE